MSVTELLSAIHADGLTLRTDGDRLKVSGPDDALTRWTPTLKKHKSEILQELTEPDPLTGYAILLDSALAGGVLWLVRGEDEADRLREGIRSGRVVIDCPVFTADEIMKLADLPREAAKAAYWAKRTFEGARVERGGSGEI